MGYMDFIMRLNLVSNVSSSLYVVIVHCMWLSFIVCGYHSLYVVIVHCMYGHTTGRLFFVANEYCLSFQCLGVVNTHVSYCRTISMHALLGYNNVNTAWL